MNGFIRLAGLAFLVSCASTVSAAIFTVTTTNDSGAGSLRQAMMDANAAADADTIRFSIGSGTRSIPILSALPPITQPLTLDGSTQPGFAGSAIIEVDGSAAGASTDGLRIVGGNCTIRAIVINRFDGHGIEISGAASNIVQGCIIGLRVGGSVPQPNRGSGVFITNSSYNQIGGSITAARNIIAGNSQHGVQIVSGTNNSIRRNAIYSNGQSGIELGTNGVNPNDPGDSDGGANDLQNFPIVSSATNVVTAVIVSGSLNTRPHTTCTVDFYANYACDGSGNGEGQIYIGSTNLVTDAAGEASFMLRLPISGSPPFITATATDLFGNTSEFSPCTLVSGSTSDIATGVRGTPNPVIAGQTLTYAATVTNLGPHPATGVRLSVELDNLLVLSSASVSQGSFQQAGNSIICDVGTLTVGAVTTLTILAIPSDAGTLNSSATVTTSSTDPVSANNSSMAQTTVSPGRGVLMFERASYHAMEGTSASITVVRQGGAIGDVTVDYASSDGTATAGQDYAIAHGQLTFRDGETVQSFPVLLTSDTATECNEYLNLRLTNATSGGVILLRSMATLSIAEHDAIYHSSVQLISLRSGPAGGDAYQPDVSEDGNYVAFFSYSDTLAPNDHNFNADVFVYDRMTKANLLASVNMAGTGTGNGFSGAPSISGDGRYVAFQSDASNLVPADNNNEQDIFVRDMVTGTTTLVSRNRAGTGPGNGYSYDPVISADGRYVAFVSYATDLTTNTDDNNGEDVFLRDLMAGATWLVSIRSSAARVGNAASYSPRSVQTAAGGAFVLFLSDADNLTGASDMNDAADVFVRDIRGTTHLISMARTGNRSGNQASGEPYMFVNATGGVYVAFTSFASDLAPNDNNSASDVFLREVPLARTSLISVNSTATGSGNESSGRPSMSRDLRYVAFESRASNLAAGDGNNADDIFVRDLINGTTVLATRNCAGTTSADAYSYDARISADGRYVVFASAASDLVPGLFPNRSENVYRHDLVKRKTSLISQNWNQTGGGTNHSYAPSLSTNGAVIAFESLAPNLARGDTNSQQDVFAWGALAPETLGIKLVSGGVQVQWSSETAAEFSLEQASNLNSVIMWSPVTNAVVDDGVTRAAAIREGISRPQGYYRLRRP